MVAQAIDYAYWVEKLLPQDIAAIYERFAPGRTLAEDFKQRFGQVLEEDGINQNHQIVIVASSLDDSTERIVSYLSERNIPINVLCFQTFKNGDEQIISRSWLLDPMSTQVNVAATNNVQNEPWNGENYCSFGQSETRSRDDAVNFGFICAGGGAWYSKTLKLLSPGDRVWVNVIGNGFAGVGQVIGLAQPASTFRVKTSDTEMPVLDVVKGGSYHKEFIDDPERCEYFVPVKWLQTVPLQEAIHEIGMFGNQNTICRPTTPKWHFTVERLKKYFPNFNRMDGQVGEDINN